MSYLPSTQNVPYTEAEHLFQARMTKRRKHEKILYVMPMKKKKKSNPGSIKEIMPALSRVYRVTVSPEILRRIPMAISWSPEIDSITIPPITHCCSQGSFGYGSQCNLESICSCKKTSPSVFISMSSTVSKLSI